MRRPLAASAVALSLATSLLGGLAHAQDDHAHLRLHSSPAVRVGTTAATTPAAALRTAHEVLSGTAGTSGTRSATAAPSATLALRDLFAARDKLTGDARTRADRILARPSASHSKCNVHVCVHWKTSGANAATTAWAKKTLDYMGTVWKKEVGKLNFRAPLKDGTHGGSSKLDVYLQDLGGQGIYGYCAPEYLGAKPRTASGYCSLDNDFSRAQFGIKPENALHVTAAHEFFHASQFAYDYLEDAWIMEATATWMEEQVADDVNDNRQYLPYGQLGTPEGSLDYFDQAGVGQYGQWLYFQYLQQVYGTGVVRSIWNQLPGRTAYSVKVLESAINGSFDQQYAGFVAANLLPGSFYAEGSHYPAPYTGGPAINAGGGLPATATLDHLTSVGAQVVPGSGLESTTWQLQVNMDGPSDVSHPMLVVVWQGTSGTVHRYVMDTDADGVATKSVPFSSTNTQAVYIAMVNAGNRYDCFHSTDYACAGNSKDDAQDFSLTVSTVEP